MLYSATSSSWTVDAEDNSRKSIIAATFLPIVKPDKMESFLADWGKWFVLEDTHEDAKIPGKLKSKASSNDSHRFLNYG